MIAPNSLADVSRETRDRLESFVELIRKWNPAINLVAKSTLHDIWTRHIVDSAQLLEFAPRNRGLWVDLGSGGGFPGLVIAILASEFAPDLHVTCIEADLRKAAFLKTASRDIGVDIGVLSRRIEDAPPQKADVLSARALTSLSNLLVHAKRHLKPGGRALFLKGRSWREELDAALVNWRFEVETYPSKTTQESVVLSIGGIERV